MPANTLTPREALEEIARRIVGWSQGKAPSGYMLTELRRILSRVSPQEEPQRGHASLFIEKWKWFLYCHALQHEAIEEAIRAAKDEEITDCIKDLESWGEPQAVSVLLARRENLRGKERIAARAKEEKQ